MAKESGRNHHAEGLKEEIALSREQVGRNLQGLRYELDFSRKIRRSFRKEPLPWIATAAAVGIFVVLMVARRKKIYVAPKNYVTPPPNKFLTAGLALGALRIASGLLRPIIISFLENKLGGSQNGPRPVKKW
jgi:hypothetical protein